MKYIQWVCPACRLKNYLGVEDCKDEQKESHTCKFCHCISEIRYSNSIISRVEFKEYDGMHGNVLNVAIKSLISVRRLKIETRIKINYNIMHVGWFKNIIYYMI